MKQPTVYILQEPNSERDLSSASKFGKINFIFGSNEKPALNTESSMDKLYDAMEGYDPEQDFICFAGGDPLLEFLCGVVVVNLGVPHITRLIWNRERSPNGQRNGNGFYVPKKIVLNEGNYGYQG